MGYIAFAYHYHSRLGYIHEQQLSSFDFLTADYERAWCPKWFALEICFQSVGNRKSNEDS
jgi:hypothetical protein